MFVIRDKRTGELYPPKSTHREELMGFARDHTYACMRNSERRANKQEHEDLRCGLLGNAIQAQLLAHLVAPALKELGYLTQDFSPSDLLHAVNGAA